MYPLNWLAVLFSSPALLEAVTAITGSETRLAACGSPQGRSPSITGIRISSNTKSGLAFLQTGYGFWPLFAKQTR